MALCFASFKFCFLVLRAALRNLFLGFANSINCFSWRPLPGDKFVSKQWLCHLLRSHRFITENETIIDTSLEPLKNHRGLVADMKRLRVHFERQLPDTKKECFSRTFIWKQSPFTFSSLAHPLTSPVREVQAYQSSFLYQKLLPYCPLVYYSHCNTLFCEYLILMEDFSERAAEHQLSLMLGNQIWGVPPSIAMVPEKDVLLTLHLLFRQAAKFHAQNWKDKRIMQHSWLKGVSWYQGEGQAEWERSMAKIKTSWTQFKKDTVCLSKGDVSSIQLSPKFISIVDASFQATCWEKFQAHLCDPKVPWTLCHGDFHAGNMFLVKRDKGTSLPPHYDLPSWDIQWFDWPEVGPWEPTTDLAQFLISDVPSAMFRCHARSLLGSYWDALVAYGISAQDYPFDYCWERFCCGGIERWIWMFTLITGLPNVPPIFLQYLHDQILAFMELEGKERPFYELKDMVDM